MEFFLFLNLSVAIFGFIMAMASRGRYKKRSIDLENEIKKLKAIINSSNTNASVKAANVLSNEVSTAPSTTVAPSSPSVPVATEKPVVASSEATEINVQPVVAKSPVVEPVRTVAPVIKSPKKTKISVIALSFAFGVMLLIISAAVFITATWNTLPAFVKAPILFGVVAVVWGFSFITTKKFNIEKTGSALYILGSCLMPLAILGTVLAMDKEPGLITLMLCSASLMVTGFVGYKIFKSKFQVGISITGLAWLIIFLTMKILNPLDGFILGFAIVLVVFMIVYELSKTEVFKYASEVMTYASPIVYIMAAVECYSSNEALYMFINIAALLMIVSCMIFFIRRRGFAKYVVPVFMAAALPIVTNAVFYYGEEIGWSIGAIVFAFAYIAIMYYALKKIKIQSSISSALLTIASAITSIVVTTDLHSDYYILKAIIIGITAVTAYFSYYVQKNTIERIIYSVIGAASSVLMLCTAITNIYVELYVILGVIVALGVVNKITKKIPFIYEAMALSGLVAMMISLVDHPDDYWRGIPIVLVLLSAYIFRRTKYELPIYASLVAVSSLFEISLITEGHALVFVYIVMGISLVAFAGRYVTKAIAYIYEAFTVAGIFAVFATTSVESIHTSIIIFVLFLTIPAYLMLCYKRDMLRDVLVSISGAAAVGAGAKLIYDLANNNWEIFAVLCYFMAIYALTIMVIRFRKINYIPVDIFKYLIVSALSIMSIVYACMCDTSGVPLTYTVALVMFAIWTVTSVFEKRNYATALPPIMLIAMLGEIADCEDFPVAICVLLAVIIIAVFTTVGRFINRRVFSTEKGIDWLTVSAPLAVIMFSSFENVICASSLAFAFYAMTFVGRFVQSGEGFKTSLKSNLRIIGSISLAFVAISISSLIAQYYPTSSIDLGFMSLPSSFVIEVVLLPLLIAAAIIAFVIKLPVVGRWIWFTAVAMFVHIVAIVALVDGETIHLLIVGILGLALFLLAFILKNKSWFALSIETIAGIGVYMAITFWDSKLWWVYLLIAGLILIGTATVSEIKRRSVKSAEGEKTPRFKEWKW